MAYHSPLAATLNEPDTRVIETRSTALRVSHAPHEGLIRDSAVGVHSWSRAPSLGERSSGAFYRELQEHALDLEHLRRDTFVSTLAHELRQPLSALLAAVEVVRLAPDVAAANQLAEVMKRQIGQMDRVIGDLMDAARWAHGNVTICRQRLDVRDLVRDAALDVEAAVAERGHQFVVTTALEPLWADADPQRLQQVLSNLLRNAVKYTDPGGRILLAAGREAATVIVRVGDSGRGIEPEALPHIFDLFTQVRPADGLGLGLSVVREIVALHEGRIEARSDGPGHGSEFIVRLPLAPSGGRSECLLPGR